MTGRAGALVVPGWRPRRQIAAADAILFRVTDRPVQQSPGLWREERARHAG